MDDKQNTMEQQISPSPPPTIVCPTFVGYGIPQYNKTIMTTTVTTQYTRLEGVTQFVTVLLQSNRIEFIF